MKRVTDLYVTGKRVLVRVDFNVPLNNENEITDDNRITAALPTIGYLTEKGAKTILCSHLGRPKGKRVENLSLSPVAKRLEQMLNIPVKMAPDCIGEEVIRLVGDIPEGGILLLENLRFHPGEESDDPDFAKQLASLADLYVNDAFAVCHRKNASVVSVVRYVKEACAGLLLAKELEFLEKALKEPERPLLAIVGGAKISTKIPALRSLTEKADRIVIGGAMANTFLLSTGLDPGRSRVEPEHAKEAKEIMELAVKNSTSLYLPKDVIAGSIDHPDSAQRFPVDGIPHDMAALDIGPTTISIFSAAVQDSGTILWNGPMGVFEKEPFSAGTIAIARAVAKSRAFSIAGGGDTVAAIEKAGVKDLISYISTGGGAFLRMLQGTGLPGVNVLKGDS